MVKVPIKQPTQLQYLHQTHTQFESNLSVTHEPLMCVYYLVAELLLYNASYIAM